MKFVKESYINSSPERVFAFHELPDALEHLIAPNEQVRIIQKADISVPGSRAIIEKRIFGLFTTRWVAEHTAYDPPRSFEDIQIEGPFKSWRHRHIIIPQESGAILRDEIEYTMPIPIFGPMAAPLSVEPWLREMFDYRHKVTAEWCENV